jgi:hypothetical protein
MCTHRCIQIGQYLSCVSGAQVVLLAVCSGVLSVLQLLRPCIPDEQLLLLLQLLSTLPVWSAVCVLLRVERECISVKKLDCGFMHHRDQRWIPGSYISCTPLLLSHTHT